MGFSWITLQAPIDRAIPEPFISRLISEEIIPILLFKMPVDPQPDLKEFRLLFESYSNWGVRFITLYDRPNSKQSWPVSSWAQSELVERFLDAYLPLAELAVQYDLIPVFSCT